MKPRREDLDETIDRVASQMTYVSADSSLPTRIAARLPRAQPTFAWPQLAMAMIAIAAVGVTAIVLMRNQSTRVPVRVAVQQTPATSEPEATASKTVAAPRASDQQAPAHLVASRGPAARPTALTRELLEIDPLSSQSSIAIDELETSPLTLALVDLSPLDVASLSENGSDGPDVPKE